MVDRSLLVPGCSLAGLATLAALVFLYEPAALATLPPQSVESRAIESPVTVTQSRGGRPSDAVQATARGGREFALDLYRLLAAQGDGNLCYSPHSVRTALALAYAGADGTTRDEMAAALHLSLSPVEQHAALAELSRAVASAARRSGAQWHEANRLWVQAGLPLQPEYLSLLRSHYDAAPATVDFERDSEAARGAINAWVAEQTSQKIAQLLAPDSLAADTRLVLTNAVYFHAEWDAPFDKKWTRDADFNLADGQQVPVRMMHRWAKFGYAEDERVQVLEIAYRRGTMSMLVVLPKDGAELPALERQLDNEQLEAWTAALRERDVQVFLPRAKVSGDWQLAEVLAALGMPTAFSDAADFSGITPGRDLLLSRVVHQAVVEINEEGTEAAASTAVGLAPTSAPLEEEPAPVFRADHPFVVLVRDNATGALLFVARVADPRG